MNIIKVNVNFEKRIIYKSGIDLTSGDYNSTKLIFEFDREEGRKVFEMKDPDGNLVLATDIVNNEVDLVGKDENGNKASLFTQAGNYIFEISLYDGESKLTSEFNYINVKAEQVVVDGNPITAYLPILDKLINEVENLNIEIENGVVTITKKDGTTKSENVKGDAYVITDEDLDEIETNVKSDIQPILEEAKENSETAISIAKGANQCKTYADYPTFIEAFNLIPKDKYDVGQDIRIIQVNVPDIWIAYVEEENIEYTYTTDEDFISELVTNGIVQIGYYKFGMLETQKVDLTDYVKNTDYATSSKGGVIRSSTTYGVSVNSSGSPMCNNLTYANYNKATGGLFISKSTLENVLNGRFVTLTQAEYDALVENGTYTREDGTKLTYYEDTYYDIVEE